MIITNEIKDEVYEKLINYVFNKFDAVMFVSHPLGLTKDKIKILDENITVLKEKLKLSNYKIRHSNHWVYSAVYKGPGEDLPSELEQQFNVMFYKLDDKVKEYLLSNKDLYNWLNPEYPEDISFFKNGYCWLRSVSHEGICDIYCENEEEYEYLRSIGIRFREKEFTPTPIDKLYYEDYGLKNTKTDNKEISLKEACGFNRLFGEAQGNVAIYKNEKIYLSYIYQTKGRHTVKFKLIYSNSDAERGISLLKHHLKGNIMNTKGEIIAKGGGGVYSNYDFFESNWKENEEIIVNLEDGYIKITNGKFKMSRDVRFFDPTDVWQAMKVEKISPTKLRFYCNDTVLEDDFDDLIFEMEILD